MKKPGMNKANEGATAKLTLNDLRGEWFVVMSNFPMWLKGDKLCPRFNYDIEIQKNIIGLKDEVGYIEKNRYKTIKGFDKPLNVLNTEFEWRGEGLLKLITSRWEIVNYDTVGKNWMIIQFKSTLFTPAGIDIISRTPTIPPLKLQLITQLVPPQKKALQLIPQSL